MVVSSLGTTRRQHRLHGRPRQGRRLTGLILALAACQQRLGASPRYGSRLQAQRNRQRRRMLQSFSPPRPWRWWAGERFWWGLRWFGGGMAVALLASRCGG
ncbi:MAG: hypothetical protein TE42_08730 [Candidatus Synechococcus spongiarum SP3]|uniref:Uncharacterized protein n=1 Tax=Candidatus Synechococcus spongiarum SP3 TaxID=1604020 RepID=A0A0G2HJH0_9SYNE|nr:MAG: hypothetical protein TE42_08730 [Candidatus Synechococcus spongiarum SP3]